MILTMKKILDINAERIFPATEGFIYALNTKSGSKNSALKFFTYNFKREASAASEQSVYIEKKFGGNPLASVYEISHSVNCDAASLADGKAILLFYDGDIGIFSPDGKLIESGKFLYNGSPARCVLPDGNDFWSVVPEKGVILKISASTGKMIIRIGGGNNSPFKYPSHISKYDENLFICDEKCKKIQRVNLKDYRVSDYMSFTEPVRQYLRVGNRELALLESGVYLIK